MKKLILVAAVLSSMLTACTSKPISTGTTFQEVVTTRRSIRNYDATRTISEAEVRQLLTTTQEAPSWANNQPSKYYVAMTPEKVNAVKELIGDFNKRNVEGAPVLMVSTYEKEKSGFFQGQATNEIGNGWGAYDNGVSNAYLVLTARAMGFDTLIMGMRDADALRTLFSIPESETIMAVIALGYRAGEPNRPGRRNLDEIVKFY